MRDKLIKEIRPVLVARATQNPSMTDARIKERIGDLVDDRYQEFCDE